MYFCNMEFGEFILAHDGDDLGRLALSRDRHSADVKDFDLALTTLEVRRKLCAKVPQWHAVPSLRYPLRLSGEQCSSTETARYKASVALAAVTNSTGAKTASNAPTQSRAGLNWGENGLKRPYSVADLTGGLGVDTWAFSQVFDRVLYNEMRPELADAARRNFRELGMENVLVRNRELRPGNLAQVLDGFLPDLIFLDPARRAQDGRKVFRLEDCQPDVLQLLPELQEACPLVLLKLSPMADITLVCNQLQTVREVHVVAAEGECKELLLLLERNWTGPYSVTVYESGAVAVVSGGEGDIPRSVATLGRVRGRGPSEMGGVAKRRSGDITLFSGMSLFEPGKALLKAGSFDWPCQFGLEKLGRHTHYYLASGPVDALAPFGKWFHILESVPLNNKSIKEIGGRYPGADVTARNIPITSEDLRSKLAKHSSSPAGIVPNGPLHIFGVRIDHLQANFLLVCVR